MQQIKVEINKKLIIYLFVLDVFTIKSLIVTVELTRSRNSVDL